MKYRITFLQEVEQIVDVENIAQAAVLAERRKYREGDSLRVLSIVIIKEGEAPAPKNPTPFGKPPAGSPGTPVLAEQVITEAVAA